MLKIFDFKISTIKKYPKTVFVFSKTNRPFGKKSFSKFFIKNKNVKKVILFLDIMRRECVCWTLARAGQVFQDLQVCFFKNE